MSAHKIVSRSNQFLGVLVVGQTFFPAALQTKEQISVEVVSLKQVDVPLIRVSHYYLVEWLELAQYAELVPISLLL